MKEFKRFITTGIMLAVSTLSFGAGSKWELETTYNFGLNRQQQPHLVKSDGTLTFSAEEIPWSAVDKQSPARSAVWAQEHVKFVANQINTERIYKLKLTFLNKVDSTLAISIAENIVADTVELKANQPKIIELNISPEAYQNGLLEVSIFGKNGGCALLSFAELWSQQYAQQDATDHQLDKENILLPRLSPIPVQLNGTDREVQSLNGTWRFCPAPETDFYKKDSSSNWEEIQVPGEWSMQGFDVPTDTFGGYVRNVAIPQTMAGQRIKLRFGAVYSECRIYLNGQKVGEHLGGFTPFELDVTDAARIGGKNILALEVKNKSIADSLANGTKYACHPLGGISRNVELFALPEVNISDAWIHTSFDQTYTDAILHLAITVANEGTVPVSTAKLNFSLSHWKSLEKIILRPGSTDVPMLLPGKTAEIKVDIPVVAPHQWNSETPNLYTLKTALSIQGEAKETICQRFGFREVKVQGNELLVNGKPVKLRGVCRHEVHPTAGRAYIPGLARKDVELFREANVNLIRTSHYPSSKELVEAADELGMFLEMEGPFCWAHNTKGDEEIIRATAISQTLEMLIRDRSNPSVIIWSIANESNAAWDRYFPDVCKIVEQVDPSRPRIFNWIGGDIKTQTEGYCDIATIHYPGMKTIEKIKRYQKRPVYYGEYAHVNAYNRYELATDQGLRARWSKYLKHSWDTVYETDGALGASIWAAIDDTFYWDFKLPDGSIEKRTVGYGTWGPIDGWRRKKPEWWGMKKTYSPIHILTKNPEVRNGQITLQVENRHNFHNLSDLNITFSAGAKTGIISANIAPHSTGELVLPVDEKSAEKLELTVFDPRGFMIDTFILPLQPPINLSSTHGNQSKCSVVDRNGIITISGKETTYIIDRKTGLLTSAQKNGHFFNFSGPYLMILPLNKNGGKQMTGIGQIYAPYTDTCTEWSREKVNVSDAGEEIQVRVEGSYKEASGQYIYTFKADGSIEIKYDFKSTGQKVSPRQLGIVFDLPSEFKTLTWKRKGFWSTYPDWHIARLEGTVQADEGFPATLTGPRTQPEHPWRLDRSSLGNNDFCSTKHNIYSASLADETGTGVQVIANADQHIRSWVAEEKVRLLIADYSNGGAEKFLQRLSNIDYISLKKGDLITGKTKLKLIDASKGN